MSTPSTLSAVQKLYSFLARNEKLQWIGIIGFALCTSILEIITASVIIVFVKVLNQPEAGQKYLSMIGIKEIQSSNRIIFYMAILFAMIYLVKNLIAAAEIFHQSFSIQKMSYHFKNKLLHRYAKIDYGFYLTRNSSLGMQVVSSDAEIMFSNGMMALANILSEGIVFFCLLFMIIWMNPSLALIVLGISIVLGLIIIKILLPLFYRWGKALQEAALHSGQNLSQFFHAFKEMVLLGKRDAFINAYQAHSHTKARIQAIQNATNALPRIVIEVLFVGLFMITIAYLCIDHENPIQMVGILGGYLYAGFRLMPGLNRMISQLNSFKAVIPAIERVYDEYHTIAAQESYKDVPELRFDKNIIISNMSFRYLNTKMDSLSNIHFEIKKGECIGIVGETGSGKSTLMDIILGLLLPSEGSILIDGQYPVNSYQWHEKIGYVPQTIYLTDDTIEANIAFGEKAEDINQQQLNKAIDDSQLRKFIDRLPHKTQTIVGERGIRLSGGERQRISIARALYHNPEVLIFDEATSALDSETEERLMETIHMVSQNRTVIMVAHRLTTLKDCEHILVMERGKLVRVTSYNDLIKK